MVRETRHLWVGNLPENVREEKIIEHFKRYGRVESVKVLPKRGSEGGVAAFVDFVDIKSAQKAHNAINKMGDRDLRTDYNEPGTIPSAARGLDDSLSLGSRGRDVSGFTRAAGGAVYGPPASLHSRDGRYERRLDGRDRAYDHSAYGHHDRPGSSFERQRHYETDYYRDARDRTLRSTSSGVGFYRSHSRSPCRFETPEPRYESRTREPFTLASVVHRDLYREDRGRRGERSYRHSHSRSPHSTHSRNPSPQRLASQATRPPRSHSGSGSRSRSSSSDSVSSTSSSTSGSDSSSSSSDDSPARSVQSAAVPAPSALPLSSLDKDEPRKSFGIKVQNLPVRSTDTSLKDGLFHEFKKHGKVTSVQIHGASEERYGLVFFRQQEDQEKALGASKGKLFFGMQIDVTAWNGPETESENEFRPLDERIDEFHPKATRTLFIGNLEKTTTYHDLLNIFQRFGEIVDIDIKKVNGAPQYAFLQYCDIASVCKAIKKMDGEYLGNNRLKLGFGKSMPTTCVWLDGLASNTTEQFLTRHFCRYGHVVKVVLDRMKGMALILYNNIEYAQAAVKDTKGWKIGGSKIKVDFANQESQMAFYRSMQASGQDIRDFYDILAERRDDRRTLYDFQAERQYYENVRTTGTYTEDPRRKYPARSREFYTEWDPYQGDYYDPQYFEDPREYREYRADPYEQDIRKYSYLQRERERERERFETDRGRDHGRRTIERSQSPSHITSRRPASPSASPSLSERIPSDSDRRICCRSSERSGSCSSISPPRFEKLEKTRTERYNKTEKLEKDRLFEAERSSVVEKEKRSGRKDRGDKDKSEKQKMKKLKVASPVIHPCETESELEKDVSPESVFRNKNNKIQKESSSKGRLDLLPCVVQLTRVKEKEGKLIGNSIQDKPVQKIDSPRLLSPSDDQRSPPFRSESLKNDVSKHGKVHRDKNMHSLVEFIDKDAKIKPKKHGKSEIAFDSGIPVDVDRLAARKRRFEDPAKTDRPKRNSEEDFVRHGLHKLWTNAKETDLDKNLLIKGLHKKDYHKEKCVRMISGTSPKDGRDCESNTVGLSLEQQSHMGDVAEDCSDHLDSPYFKMDLEGSKSENSNLTKLSDEGSPDLDEFKEQQKQISSENELGREKCRDSDDGDDISVHIDQNAISKHVEQSRWLRPKLCDPEKLLKLDNLPSKDSCDFEKDYMLDVGKATRDTTQEDFLCKRKKFESFDLQTVTPKIDRNFGSSQKLHEDTYQNMTPPIPRGLFSNDEDEKSQAPASISKKERKSTPVDDKFSHTETLKSSLGPTATHFQSPDSDFPKLKTNLFGCDEELMQHWERRLKSDSDRLEWTFPSDIAKRENPRKRLGQDLEPGEVQTDSEDEADSRHISPKSSSSLSYLLRERGERMTNLKLSGSLEKNKFYSFALDKTITPDTKALLERAKTLYSSREDNWSFLPSRFPTSHSSSDKDKVDLAPRPIPSWYMKKKKIRTDSVEKIHDKKEELKPPDQERQDLFASRFLHSSIFEQDSRRLQHLERKDTHLETSIAKSSSKPGASEVQPESGPGDIPQEPIVLFHSRFLELQQQRDKEQHHPDTENELTVTEVKENEVPNCENVLPDKEPEPLPKADDKIIVNSATASNSLCGSPAKEVSSPENKDFLMPTFDQPSYVVKEEKAEEVLEMPSQSLQKEDCKPIAPKLTVSLTPVLYEMENKLQKSELFESKIKIEGNLEIGNSPLVVEKPPTPDSSERKSVDFAYADCSKTEEKNEIVKAEPKMENVENKDIEEPQKPETDIDVCMPELEVEIKPLPNRRQAKNKRTKQVSGLRTLQASQIVASEKPATRKSERIDKEKLKRASSPRAEVPKSSESKSTSKSPIHASDSDQNIESSLILGRTRRRNVRSVYATLHEDDQAAKEAAEPSRSMRKRGGDKEPIQDVQIPSTNTRRGRPPKRGVKRIEEVSPFKGDQQKIIEEDTETSNIIEAVKSSEGWRSPRTQKTPQTQMTACPVHKKGGRTDKQSESMKVFGDQNEFAGNAESDNNPKDESELSVESEKAENVNTPHRNEKDMKDFNVKKSVDGNIRVSVDDVKGLIQSKIVLKETKQSPQEKEDSSSEAELPDDPAALLAQQMELERAVENIAKLTVEHPTRPYKEQPPSQPRILRPAIEAEPEAEVEEEKRAIPASETELAAAIDSITAEEADAESFAAPATYTALIPTPESVISSSNEILEPEAHVILNSNLATDSDDSPLTRSPQSMMLQAKTAANAPVPDTPKKIGKVRAKTPKKARSRKGAVAKKGDTLEEVSQADPSPVKLPESIPEDPEMIKSKTVAVAGANAAASVVTAVATCRRDVTSAITVDTPKEAEQPDVDQPVPKESAFHSGPSNSSCKKPPQTAEPCTPTLASATSCPQPISQFSVPLLQPAKIQLSPDWPPRNEESRICVAPSCHVTVVTPSAPASATLGTASNNPPKPPDTKASDIDPSSSTLRKILMEPKYVSASNNNSVPSTTVTSTLSKTLRVAENESISDTLGSRQFNPEERSSLHNQPIQHKPFLLTESQNCREKSQHTVISPTTSVISRIPMPYDTEETPRISLSNRSTGLALPKQKFRPTSNENNRHHGMDIVEDGTRVRSVVETIPYNTGSGPGLRVNTSEGVVVLSYSGQKTEGPHRMRAKISQIPQASAGDLEFQQSVSKSSLKQDPVITSSQSTTPKPSSTPAAYGHTGVLLTGQSYNAQPVISSTKQENLACDKSEAPYHTATQGGVVKMFQQPISSPKVLMYNQPVIQQQHSKNGLGADHLPKKMDISKTAQHSNISPVLSPHHPSLSGSRMSPNPSIPPDRSAVHLKQELQSPRAAVQSALPFGKTCPPSSSPRGTSVVLGHRVPGMTTYHSGIHHPTSEPSSVIIQPHSVTQSVTHEARMNSTPMSGISYGRRGESLSSPHPAPSQRSNTPQPKVIREMTHSSPQGSVLGGGSSINEDDHRHFNQALSRSSMPQLQPEVMMIHGDHRGLHPNIRLDQYRDMHQRILIHHNVSVSAKSPVVGKSLELSAKESFKPLEGKLMHPPSSESRIRGVHASSPVMVSPHAHGVQMMCPGGAGSFPVYRDMRGYQSQFPGRASPGHNLPNQGMPSSQVSLIIGVCSIIQVPPEPELGHRSQMSQSHVGGSDSKPETSHLRHATSAELSHLSRIQGDGVSPSYQSPMTSPKGLAHKSDLTLQNGPPAFLSTPPPTVPAASAGHPRPDAKLEHAGHRSIDTVQLLTKYPIVWQGLLALKNDQAAVQLHFVSGNTILAQRSLPPPEGGPYLRIVQRMRLEASQLDSVARRMTVESDYCLLLALPCGRDQEDVLGQTQALKSAFITYLQAKQAAGIINVPNPGSNQPAYVVQIFPPCEFSESHLSRLAPDLLSSISSISPHLMIVIAAV
uniref:Msx2-interacting protein n=1 Tax=Takifugu rubripes TaxID=31033 RepID=A0A674NRQ4_TAKRU